MKNRKPKIEDRKPEMPRSRGFVMVLVVGFAALALATTTAYLALNSTALPIAMNQQAAVRAQYLAGSGIALATHYLAKPPTTVTAGNYWSGVTGFSIDSTSDTVDVTVTQSATAQENYTVTAIGTAKNTDGTVRGKSTVTSEIITPPPFGWTLTRMYCSSGTVSIPDNMSLTGAFHANGNLTCASPVSGSLTATGSVTYTGGGSPTRTGSVTAVTMPTMSTTQWNRYVIHGVVRAATTFSSSSLTSANVVAVGGKASITANMASDGTVTLIDSSGSGGLLGTLVKTVVSAVGLTGTQRTAPSVVSNNNPGGVLIYNGNLDLPSGANGLIGTLVVVGDLRMRNNSTASFCAMPGYPALVVTGKIQLDNGAETETFGPVLYADRCEGGKPKLSANGPWLSYGSGFKSDFAGSLGLVEWLAGIRVTFSWSSAFQNYYDFSNTTVQPMTLLSWAEL